MEGVKSVLVIAGSDKRGTIYGLFYLSEKLGVSPLVNWNHVLPKRREYVILTEKDSFVSKEPSVKYRGFFINDEWPAFGTWVDKLLKNRERLLRQSISRLQLTNRS